MKRVIIESPYAGLITRNVEYARKAVRDCIARGEAPIASHLLFTQPGILDDDVPEQRKLGIEAGLTWAAVADYTAFYVDYGWSRGMSSALEVAYQEGRVYKIRSFYLDPVTTLIQVMTKAPLDSMMVACS